MPKLPIIKAKQLIRALEKLGFFKHHQIGSHAQFKHLDGRRITVPIHQGRDLKKKFIKGIINDLEINLEIFLNLLKK
jgi:predicted RNA binding protein YcfA (HicA-like mRNA interferase family)